MSIELSRRDFLKFLGIVGAAGAGVALGHGFRTRNPEPDLVPVYPSDFWLERGILDRGPMIDVLKKGHLDYLVNIASGNEAVKEMVHLGFINLLEGEKPQRRPLLGEYFDAHVKRAQRVLKRHYHDINNPNDQPRLKDAIHCAVYSMAAVLHPDIINNSKLLDKFNISLPENKFDASNLITNSFSQKVPVLFPVKATDEIDPDNRFMRYMGYDRTIHFAQHLFMTSMYLGALQKNFQDARRMNNFLDLMLRSQTDPEIKAKLLSEIIGNGWELREGLLSPLDWYKPLKFENYVPTGFVWDNFTDLDLGANDLGARFGIALAGNDISQERYRELINDLNNPQLSLFVTNPKHPPYISLAPGDRIIQNGLRTESKEVSEDLTNVFNPNRIPVSRVVFTDNQV